MVAAKWWEPIFLPRMCCSNCSLCGGGRGGGHGKSSYYHFHITDEETQTEGDKVNCPRSYTMAGVSNSFSLGGNISLEVAFKGSNVILGLYKCNYSLIRARSSALALGWYKVLGQIKQGGGPDSALVFATCALWLEVKIRLHNPGTLDSKPLGLPTMTYICGLRFSLRCCDLAWLSKFYSNGTYKKLHGLFDGCRFKLGLGQEKRPQGSNINSWCL